MSNNVFNSNPKSVFEYGQKGSNPYLTKHTPKQDSIHLCSCSENRFWEDNLFNAVMGVLKLLNRTSLLSSAAYIPIKYYVNTGALGEPSPEFISTTHNHVTKMIQEELSGKNSSSDWKKLCHAYKSLVFKDGNRTFVDDPTFERELEQIMGSAFTSNNKVKLLPDGPAAFGKRYRLLDKNPSRVYISTWAFKDGATSKEFSKKLSELAKKGVDVRVVVDKKISKRSSNKETLELMKLNGVKVAYWELPNNSINILHGKIFIADDQAILGGTNYGDEYSHAFRVEDQNPSMPYGKWRDTDTLVKGPSTVSALKAFADIWNQAIEDTTLKMDHSQTQLISDPQKSNPIRTAPEIKEKEEKLNIFPRVKIKDGKVALAVSPSGTSPEKDGITLGMLKLIWGAKKQIDIENAYYIRMPMFSEALLDALKRGVKVRILTNSKESIDNATIISPIYESLHEMIENGAEVYLKTGKTLHSKFMQVDNKYTCIGSYNLNPRSIKYDYETNYFIKSDTFSKGVKSVFEKDISIENAIRIKNVENLPAVSSIKSRFMSKHFYDHL